MARTQLNRHGISDQNLTGASMTTEMGIWDETLNYTIDQEVYWNTKIYKCTSGTTGQAEGVLTGSPDTTPGNWTQVIASAPPNTYAFCTNGTAQIYNSTEIRVELANITSTANVTISDVTDQATIQTTGRYRISYKMNLRDTGNQRVIATGYFKRNNAQILQTKSYAYLRNSSDPFGSISFTGTIDLTAGDIIDVWTIINSGNNVTVITNESYFEFEYIALS